MKKFLSIVLSIAMILGTMSTVVFADAPEVDIAVVKVRNTKHGLRQSTTQAILTKTAK